MFGNASLFNYGASELRWTLSTVWSTLYTHDVSAVVPPPSSDDRLINTGALKIRG
jgi:hypothetical protein